MPEKYFSMMQSQMHMKNLGGEFNDSQQGPFGKNRSVVLGSQNPIAFAAKRE